MYSKHLTEQNPNTRSDNKSGLKEENKDKNRNLELVPGISCLIQKTVMDVN